MNYGWGHYSYKEQDIFTTIEVHVDGEHESIDSEGLTHLRSNFIRWQILNKNTHPRNRATYNLFPYRGVVGREKGKDFIPKQVGIRTKGEPNKVHLEKLVTLLSNTYFPDNFNDYFLENYGETHLAYKDDEKKHVIANTVFPLKETYEKILELESQNYDSEQIMLIIINFFNKNLFLYEKSPKILDILKNKEDTLKTDFSLDEITQVFKKIEAYKLPRFSELSSKLYNKFQYSTLDLILSQFPVKNDRDEALELLKEIYTYEDARKVSFQVILALVRSISSYSAIREAYERLTSKKMVYLIRMLEHSNLRLDEQSYSKSCGAIGVFIIMLDEKDISITVGNEETDFRFIDLLKNIGLSKSMKYRWLLKDSETVGKIFRINKINYNLDLGYISPTSAFYKLVILRLLRTQSIENIVDAAEAWGRVPAEKEPLDEEYYGAWNLYSFYSIVSNWDDNKSLSVEMQLMLAGKEF